jgi:diguanylate cyclase (GGDEF)-like protein
MFQLRPKVLVVDDVPNNIQLLSVALKNEYEIHIATTGEKAVELCRSKLPDLVLLDVMLPGMDGYEVCTSLKADALTRDIPVIFITARNQVEDETRGLEAGAIDFITKPISPPVVRARVRNHIQMKRQADMLRRLSFIDGLTGIANRRHFDEMLDKGWRRCGRNGSPLSVVMIDVDHFKRFNDHYGHQGGDDCLKAIAEMLAGGVGRPDDLVARFGGEEFVCLLPGTDEKGASEVAHRLQAAVREARIPHAMSPVAPHVTLSMGVATAWPGGDNAPDQLLRLADGLLYQAKSGGRNGDCAGALSRPAGATPSAG